MKLKLLSTALAGLILAGCNSDTNTNTSSTADASAIRAALVDGLQRFPAGFEESMVYNSGQGLDFETVSFSADEDTGHLLTRYTIYQFDTTGNLTTSEDSFTGELYDSSGIIWVLNDEGNFKRVDYNAQWRDSRIEDDGTLADYNLYLDVAPTQPEAELNYQLLAPDALAIVSDAVQPTLTVTDIAGKSLLSVLETMNPDSIEELATFEDPITESQTFPAGSKSYELTFPAVQEEPTISPGGSGQPNFGIYTVDANGSCSGDCDVVFDNLNDLFSLSSDRYFQVYGYDGQYENYRFRFSFNPSETGLDNGTATITGWTYDSQSAGYVEDTTFNNNLTWERKTWHGLEAIMFDEARVREFGLEEVALVDTGDNTGEAVYWAEAEFEELQTIVFVNDAAMEALVTALSTSLSAEAKRQ